MATLREHITDAKVGFGEFAARIGVSRQTLYLYMKGDRFPRPPVLRRIHAETDGAVTANDFLAASADTPQNQTAEAP